MSYFRNMFDFENFKIKDMLEQLKSHPQRILMGVDPLSTKVWNKITGTHYEPLVDALGGAYGGHTISAFGNNDGGVYARAKAAGINPGAGGNLEDAAHVAMAVFGLGGLAGALGGAGAGAGTGAADAAAAGGEAGAGAGAADAAVTPVAASGEASGAGTGGAGSSGFNWQSLLHNMPSFGGGQGGGVQQQQYLAEQQQIQQQQQIQEQERMAQVQQQLTDMLRKQQTPQFGAQPLYTTVPY
jgi:hypothetical protein